MQSHTCACNMCFISSFAINWQFRRIDHNGSHKPVSVFPLSNSTYNSHIIKNKFACKLYAHSQFLCSLQASNCPPCVSAISAAYLLIECYAYETFAQLCIFAVVNCSDVELSVFYSAVSKKPAGRI